MTLILLILILILLGGVSPVWPYSRGYGWGPSGLLGFVLLVLLILIILGHVPLGW